MTEYAWICLKSRLLNLPRILNMAKFWIRQKSQYASITQNSEYAMICLDRFLNISQILNMTGFWICKSYTQGSKYATVLPNMLEWDMNMPESVWIYDNRHVSEFLIHSARSRCKLMSACWEMGVFRTPSMIWHKTLWKNDYSF